MRTLTAFKNANDIKEVSQRASLLLHGGKRIRGEGEASAVSRRFIESEGPVARRLVCILAHFVFFDWWHPLFIIANRNTMHIAPRSVPSECWESGTKPAILSASILRQKMVDSCLTFSTRLDSISIDMVSKILSVIRSA